MLLFHICLLNRCYACKSINVSIDTDSHKPKTSSVRVELDSIAELSHLTRSIDVPVDMFCAPIIASIADYS